MQPLGILRQGLLQNLLYASSTQMKEDQLQVCTKSTYEWNSKEPYSNFMGFPGSSVVKKKKNPRANAGDTGDGDMNFILRSGRSPREGNGNPLQYSAWKIPWTEEPGGLQSMGS